MGILITVTVSPWVSEYIQRVAGSCLGNSRHFPCHLSIIYSAGNTLTPSPPKNTFEYLSFQKPMSFHATVSKTPHGVKTYSLSSLLYYIFIVTEDVRVIGVIVTYKIIISRSVMLVINLVLYLCTWCGSTLLGVLIWRYCAYELWN